MVNPIDYNPLVVSIVTQKFKWTGLNYDDLIQEGYVAILHAHKSFDPSLGVTFGAFVKTAIFRHLQEYVCKNQSQVPFNWNSGSIRQHYFSIKRMRDIDGMIAYNDIVEYSKAHNLPLKKTQEVAVACMSSTELYDDLTTLISHYKNPDRIDFDDRLIRQIKSIVNTALTDRERSIIQNIYLTDHPKTLKELGIYYNCSHQSIDNTKRRALKKIQQCL